MVQAYLSLLIILDLLVGLEKNPNIFLPNGGFFHGDESYGCESVKEQLQLNKQKVTYKTG